MIKPSLLSLRAAPVLLFFLAISGVDSAQAGFTVFKGKYGGKFTGVVAEAAGPTARAIADAATTVTANGKSAKFAITGTLNGVVYKQTIVLKKGRATLSTMIPGGSGTLAKSVSGACKVHGKSATIKVVNPGGEAGTLQVKIGFTTGGSTLIISTIVSLGGDPIYSTVIGA